MVAQSPLTLSLIGRQGGGSVRQISLKAVAFGEVSMKAKTCAVFEEEEEEKTSRLRSSNGRRLLLMPVKKKKNNPATPSTVMNGG